MKQSKFFIVTLIASLLVMGFSLAARYRAVEKLPIDYDEDDYFSAAQFYAQALRAGDWQSIREYRFNYEHPALSKLAYGLVLLSLPEAERVAEPTSPNVPPASSLPEPQFHLSRNLGVWLGSLEVLALAALNPLAGFVLAANTYQIKYNSQVMLESLPALTSALAVVCYWLGKRNVKSIQNIRRGWWYGSAIFLGLTAAAKYMYCVAGLAILVDWWLDFSNETGQVNRQTLFRGAKRILPFGLLALLTFFAANPSVWSDPLGRLSESLLYHGDYAQSEHVRQVGFPPWQPLLWLTLPVPWHPGVFWLSIDLYATFFAMFGLARLWKQKRVFALWFWMGLVFLFLWPTKWPQYILMITAPLALASAAGVEALISDPLRTWLDQKRSGKATILRQKPVTWRENLAAAPWLLPGVTLLAVITLFPLVYQLGMAMTDLSLASFKDGLQGGIWREVWNGLTGQVKAVSVNPFQLQRSNRVRYTGFSLLEYIFVTGGEGLVAFEILWTVLSVALQLGMGLTLALILERSGVKFKRFWRMIFILPWAIPEFAGALMWTQIFDPQFGWASLAAGGVGQLAQANEFLRQLINWRQSESVTLLVLLVASTWYGYPIMMLSAIAGLKLIPPSLYDAAAIDGAAGWSLFRLVTWPLLLPLMLPVIIIRAIFAFNQFYLFYVFQQENGLFTFSFISYIFVRNGGYAISAVVNVFIIAVLLILLLVFNKISRAGEEVLYA